jgi:hypothetical protein
MKITGEVSRFLGYSAADIEATMRELPDSRGRQAIDLASVV